MKQNKPEHYVIINNVTNLNNFTYLWFIHLKKYSTFLNITDKTTNIRRGICVLLFLWQPNYLGTVHVAGLQRRAREKDGLNKYEEKDYWSKLKYSNKTIEFLSISELIFYFTQFDSSAPYSTHYSLLSMANRTFSFKHVKYSNHIFDIYITCVSKNEHWIMHKNYRWGQ